MCHCGEKGSEVINFVSVHTFMNKKRALLQESRIYCVLDAQVAGYDQLFDILKCSADAGVDIFQIRDKYGSACGIMDFVKKSVDYFCGKKLFIVNDRIDIALVSNADGVHLGQDDIRINEARKITGPDMIIGVSCQTLEQAIEAQEQGADYIGFGSVFETQTKPDRLPMNLQLLKDVIKKISIPVFPIGGITVDNVNIVKECGADRVAVTRTVCLADDVLGVVQKLRDGLK